MGMTAMFHMEINENADIRIRDNGEYLTIVLDNGDHDVTIFLNRNQLQHLEDKIASALRPMGVQQ